MHIRSWNTKGWMFWSKFASKIKPKMRKPSLIWCSSVTIWRRWYRWRRTPSKSSIKKFNKLRSWQRNSSKTVMKKWKIKQFWMKKFIKLSKTDKISRRRLVNTMRWFLIKLRRKGKNSMTGPKASMRRAKNQKWYKNIEKATIQRKRKIMSKFSIRSWNILIWMKKIIKATPNTRSCWMALRRRRNSLPLFRKEKWSYKILRSTSQKKKEALIRLPKPNKMQNNEKENRKNSRQNSKTKCNQPKAKKFCRRSCMKNKET